MAEDERYTFSSLMTLLIECENKLQKYYLTASAATSDSQLATVLADFAKSISRNVASMQRARVETVVEMTLEPISNLKIADQISSINRGIEIGKAGYVQALTPLEGAVSQLYLQVSPKLASMSAETGELLLKLAREGNERVNALELLKH